MSKAANKTKKAPAKTKPKESNDDYYTKEEEERLDKFHEETGHKFTDDEIYALMVKYKNDDQAVSNELKELLKDAKRGAEYEWQEVGKDGKVKEKPKPPEKKKKKNNYIVDMIIHQVIIIQKEEGDVAVAVEEEIIMKHIQKLKKLNLFLIKKKENKKQNLKLLKIKRKIKKKIKRKI